LSRGSRCRTHERGPNFYKDKQILDQFSNPQQLKYHLCLLQSHNQVHNSLISSSHHKILFNLNNPSVQDPIIKMPSFKHSLIAIASLVGFRQVTKPLKHVSLHLTVTVLHKHHQTATKPPPAVQGQWSDSASAPRPSPQSCLLLSSPTPLSQSLRQLPSPPLQSVPIPLSFPPPRLRLLRTFFEGKNASLQAPMSLQAHTSHLRTKWTLLWTQMPRRN